MLKGVAAWLTTSVDLSTNKVLDDVVERRRLAAISGWLARP